MTGPYWTLKTAATPYIYLRWLLSVDCLANYPVYWFLTKFIDEDFYRIFSTITPSQTVPWCDVKRSHTPLTSPHTAITVTTIKMLSKKHSEFNKGNHTRLIGYILTQWGTFPLFSHSRPLSCGAKFSDLMLENILRRKQGQLQRYQESLIHFPIICKGLKKRETQSELTVYFSSKSPSPPPKKCTFNLDFDIF